MPKPLRIYYIANARMPTEKAHGIQIAKMCEAFANAGAQVTLLVPRRGNAGGDLFETYQVARNFSVEYLPVLEVDGSIPGAFVLATVSFALSALWRLRREREAAVVYTRGEQPVVLTPFLAERFTLVWETHIKPLRPRLYARTARRASALVAATKAYAAEIPALWGVAPGKIFYAPDGVALEDFGKHSREEARATLGLPREKKMVLYAGSDLPWKGLHLLREASELLGQDVLTVFVGPVKEVGPASPRRLFAGAQPYARVQLWLASADVLVLTGDPSSLTARRYTSPLKLFEYMASERPIVATDLPATRDILSENEAYLVQPDAASLARAITQALGSPEEAAARARRARQQAERYSWSARGRAILAHIQSRV